MVTGCTVWLADLSSCGDRLAALALDHGVLDRAAQDRLAKAWGAEAKRDFAASYGLLWQALGEPENLGRRLQRRPSGWVHLPNGPNFSLSRTIGWAGVAVGTAGVGLDIEAQSRTPPALDILDELSAAGVESETPNNPLASFTILEAWVKLRGQTLASVLDNPASTRELLADLPEARARGILHALDLPGRLTGHLWTERATDPPCIRFT